MDVTSTLEPLAEYYFANTTEDSFLDGNGTLGNGSLPFPTMAHNGTHHFKPQGKVFGVVVKVVYMIGIIGNAAAIVALRRGERRVRNRKHLLLLTSLAANDLVALVGMMCAMLIGEHVPGVKETQIYCAARVVLRIFGIGSVCIAVTMALERYLALTRPFFYQKISRLYALIWVVYLRVHFEAFCAMRYYKESCIVTRGPIVFQQVTYYVIRIALLISWFWAAILTCAPVFGLGLYYNPDKGPGFSRNQGPRCVRYREATNGTDLAYAIFYVTLGTVLCVILVYCNLAVISALYAMSTPRTGGQPIVRRLSKNSCRQRQRSVNGAPQGHHHNAATAEEVAFSRLMATLSVLFMICWLPQMVTSALYLSLGPTWWERLGPLANLSDVLMLLNYVLNPILYVQRRSVSPSAVCHSIAHCFKRSHKTSTESMSIKTSCCPQETVMVSDSSGAEMRPLRPHNHNLPDATLLNIDD